MNTCAKVFDKNRDKIDKAIRDLRDAIVYADNHAGEEVADPFGPPLKGVDAEVDRLKMISEELDSFESRLDQVMDCYESLSEDADEAVEILKDAEIGWSEMPEAINRAKNLLKDGV